MTELERLQTENAALRARLDEAMDMLEEHVKSRQAIGHDLRNLESRMGKLEGDRWATLSDPERRLVKVFRDLPEMARPNVLTMLAGVLIAHKQRVAGNDGLQGAYDRWREQQVRRRE